MSSSFKNIPDFGSASWKDPVSTVADLPSSGNTEGDARVVENPSPSIYIWDGSTWVQASGSGGGVTSFNTLTGDVTISAGSGITLTPAGNDIQISSSGGGSSATVNTTNATVTTLQTIAIASNTTVLLTCQVAARRTGGSAGSAGDSAGYVLTGVAKNIAGTVTLMSSPISNEWEDQVAWDADLDVNSTNVRIRVTGAVNNNITWNSNTTSLVVS